ncbi:winged helix-turn-helix domain-containing protein [Myceligenerans indicum]|uniref:Winged helix-turn-helix transcriptional regulator n=1 Tax=Myceligenerans indicum TaxID=2593663 RepID=A0ABS1LKJ8_9MICO|nr:winged helix-turn-helix domain-containing protein [Myceligenerans indicum]MBL0886741.1 winged helix-turn-helix transcriptional regulator [Myceligenerans indicum]
MTRIVPRPGDDAYVVCVGMPPEIVAQVVHALGGRHAVVVVPDRDSAVKLLTPDREAGPAPGRPHTGTGTGGPVPAAADGGRVLAFPHRGRRHEPAGALDAVPPSTGQVPVVSGAVPVVSGAFAAPPPRRGPTVHGPLTLDLAAREVRFQGREVHLSAQEFDLLATLASQPGRVWTFAELTAHVWGTRYLGDADAVTSAIKRLRRRLPRVRGLEVASVRGVGYRLRVPE